MKQDLTNDRDYARYSSLESLLLTAISLQQDYHHDWETRHRKKAILKGQLELMFDFCKDDFDISQLKVQLETFATNFCKEADTTKVTVYDVRQYFVSLSPEKKLLMSQVCRLLQLTLVMPATNATSERSFSALRRVKNYSRTTMLQERLNYVMLLHVPRESVDLLNLKQIKTNL